MELSASIAPFLCPAVAFLGPANYFGSILEDADHQENNHNASPGSWATSLLNPCNMLESTHISEPQSWEWEIHGCASRGTQLFAVPLSRSTSNPMAFNRIDIYVPDQARHPLAVRHHLRSTETACGKGISEGLFYPLRNYITRILTGWSSQQDHFEAVYRAMPFGSRIIIESFPLNIRKARVRFLPMASVQANLLHHEALCLRCPLVRLLPTVFIDQVLLERQIQDTISLVTIPTESNDKVWVLKTNIHDPKYLFHEIETLMSIGKHPNIVGPPQYLIISRTEDRASAIVYGFVLPFYEGGDLGSVIEQRKADGTLDLRTQLEWARQLTSAMIWLKGSPARYYSELKPDNVVCADDLQRLVLIDMEQSGNWETFTAPEIHYVENLRRLSQSRFVTETARKQYGELFREHLSVVNAADSFKNHGFFQEWNCLPPERQDLAMVYSLGKLMWCIFEGWSHTRNNMDEDYLEECGWEFPEFRNSPDDIRSLIRDCTQGSPEWECGPPDGLVRVESRLYPRGETGQNGQKRAGTEETISFVRRLGEGRLDDMEHYLSAKLRWERGDCRERDASVLGFPLRPKLCKVLERLEAVVHTWT